jgi:hypothetical protein
VLFHELFNDGKVSTGGVVVTRDLQVGNGIEFTDMAPEARERLNNLLTAEAASQQHFIRRRGRVPLIPLTTNLKRAVAWGKR